MPLFLPIFNDTSNDPFDRLLVAQAQAEGLTLVTGDEVVSSYGGAILWAV